jgi:hypothetical protein
MHMQRSLRLGDEAQLEALWKRFPERCRNEVVTQYARLIARAAKAPAPSMRKMRKEPADEDSSG